MFQNTTLNRSIIRPVLNQCILCNFSKDPKQSNLPSSPQDSSNQSKGTELVEKKYDPKDVTKTDMQWRTPWHKKEGQYFSFLRTFYKEDNNRKLIQWLQSDIDLSPTAIKKWWSEKEAYKEVYLQQYIPQRHQILGNELAAAHFVVFRGGAVKFFDDDKWIKADKNNEYSLPKHYEAGKYLQAIDCTDMNLHYEGLVNLRDLKRVEWLSLNGCTNMDDWCLDTVSNIFSHSLVYLDLRNCPKISDKGIGALYKMRNLKILLLDDLWKDTIYEMVCLLLQEANPALDIRGE